MDRFRQASLALTASVGMVLAGGVPALAVSAAPQWHSVPHPTEEATLHDVAVVGTEAWAVGEKSPPQAAGSPLAERWDGTAWRPVPLPPTPTGGGLMEGVDGTRPDDVWAVGDSTGQGPVLRHWDGKAWSAVPPAAPPPGEHPGSDRLYSIAAVSPTLAWSVGLFSDWDAPGPATLIERWNGTAWKRVPSPNPNPDGTTNLLRGVDAVSANRAWAAGWYVTDDGFNRAMILRWNGIAWKNVPLTLPAGHTELYGVRAFSATDVWAYGANEGRPLVLRWNGTAWRRLPLPNLTDTTLSAAERDASGGVWIAGSRMTDDGVVRRPVYLRWNGTGWTTGSTDAPEGAVLGMARRANGSIWAVGTTSPCSCYVAPPLVQTNAPAHR